jgi:hypothetical protein
MSFIPEIIIHEVVLGGTFTGVAPDGALSGPLPPNLGDPYYGGRVNFYSQSTDGGLYRSPDAVGTYLSTIMFNGAGTTDWSIDLVSDSYPAGSPVSFSYNILTYSTGIVSGFFSTAEQFVWLPTRPIFVPPNHYLKFTTIGNLSSDARLTYMVGGGWGYRTLQMFSTN